MTFTLGYDAANGLISRQVSNGAYLWHPGLTSMIYAANGLNQLTTISPGGTSTYDGRGNNLREAASGYPFGYSLENQLIAANTPGLALAYDAAGRIQTKSANSVATTFLYSGDMLVGEYNSSGTILSRYIPGPGADEAALWYSGAGTTTPQWLHADPQGSTIAWSNGLGASLGALAYDPWGQPSAWSGPRFSYTGQLMLPEVQVYHYKARTYSPLLGRFLQTDPAGMASDVNLYAYVGNDPVYGIDPSGMDPFGGDIGETGTGGGFTGMTIISGLDVWGHLLAPTSPLMQFVINDALGRLVSPNSLPKFAPNPAPQSGHDYRTKDQVCRRALSAAEQRDLMSRFALPSVFSGDPVGNAARQSG